MATPKFTALDIARIRSTGRKLVEQQYDETYDGPEVIMTSLGYVEVWPEGDDDASVTMNRVNYTLEQLERASKRKTMKGRVVRRKRRAAKNGSSQALTAAEHAALARFAASMGRSWKRELYQRRYAPKSHQGALSDVLVSATNKIGRSHLLKFRLAETNGRSRLKRTKLACARRARATRKGSSKAASRLATHCPKRRSRKAK